MYLLTFLIDNSIVYLPAVLVNRLCMADMTRMQMNKEASNL